MDLIGGLTAASTAIGIAKDLRDIDRSVDEATYKLKLAELTEALADAKLALTDAKSRISQLEEQIADLAHGPSCPVCKSGRLMISDVEKWEGKTYETHTCVCDNESCSYSTRRVFSTDRLKYRG